MHRLAAVLTFCVLAPAVLCAQDAVVSYSVTLRVATAVDAPDAIAGELAAAYGGTLGEPVRGRTFAMTISKSRARVLARDPRVESMAVEATDQTRAVTTAAEAMSWGTGVAYTYDGAGNVRKIGTDSFVYDAVSRLVQADTNGVRRNYEYDGFGNRTKCRQSEGTPTEGECQQAFTIDPGNNRVEGVTYDAAGNVTVFGGHAYTYDALNMQTRDDGAVVSREFLYTASDERIAVYTAGQSWRWTIRDTSGKVLREFASYDGPNGPGTASWQWTKDYVWRDGLLLASRQMVDSTVTTYHDHLDHLGSPRRVTDASDRIVGVHDYIPFGPEKSGGQQEPSLSLLKYTGHERDLIGAESWDTLDYMRARLYSPELGRFLSVDPSMDIKKNLPEPQRWNRYAYVTNNPLKYTDPDGRDRYQEPGFTKPLSEADWSDAPPVIQGAFYAQGALLAAGAAGGGAAGGLARGAFNLAPIARGWAIEAALAAKFGGGLPSNFPTIDRFLNGVATSVKSIDLLGKSYQNTARLTSVLTGYVDKIAQFNGGAVGQTVVRGGDVSKRVLELAIQRGVGTPQQMQAIRQATEYAKKHEIELRVILIR